MLSPEPPRKNKLLQLTTICSKTWNYITAILNTRPYLSQLDGLFKSLCLVFFLKIANPRLLHRWAWATRNNLWKRSWRDTESNPVKWKYRNSKCNFGFPLTLPKATGFSKPLVSNWDEVGPDEVWSNLISPSQQWMGWLFCRHTWCCMWPKARKAHLTFTVRNC